jgi:hypothetical protein
METQLVKLKSEFNNIITIRNSVKNIFDILQLRIDKLKQFYSEFIRDSKNDMFIFGLDSFHFQSKFIDIEYDDMKRLFLAINNRMYCEYFKLHNIIAEYIIKNITDKKLKDTVKIHNYPIYKDLEPFKEYKFEVIQDIHENILNFIGILNSTLSNRENELLIHKSKQSIGLNIDNFITTFNYNINIIREKIMMFISYIEFFHKMHTKYLKRFSNKIQLMHTHIDSDIRFDENLELSKDKKKELIENLDVGNQLSLGLLSELKKSMNSDTSTDSDLESKESAPTTSSVISNLSVTNFKEMVKNNVSKVSNILQFCNTNNNSIIDTNMSYHDITKIFSTIDFSCDEIINSENSDDIGCSQHSKDNKNNVNIGLVIDNAEESKNFSENSLFQKIEENYVEVLVKPVLEVKEEVLTELKELISNQNKEIYEENKQEQIQEIHEENKQEQIQEIHEENKQEQIQETQNKKKKKNKRK